MRGKEEEEEKREREGEEEGGKGVGVSGLLGGAVSGDVNTLDFLLGKEVGEGGGGEGERVLGGRCSDGMNFLHCAAVEGFFIIIILYIAYISFLSFF